MVELYVQSGGRGETTYLLLHGLGCTADVWQGLISLIEENGTSRWIAPDMRGHGRSPAAGSYGVGEHAADVAPLIQEAGRVVIVGHSMGALVALALATGIYGVDIDIVLGVGLKYGWPADEKAKLHAFAAKPSRWFPSHDEAVERYLLVSGLGGLIPPGDERLNSAIIEEAEGFRLAADPRTVTVGGPPDGLYAAATFASTIKLACGEYDNVVTIDELRNLDDDAIEFPGKSHNVHVEDPQLIWTLLK